jgi:gliding motility-associated lipoprotein GldH
MKTVLELHLNSIPRLMLIGFLALVSCGEPSVYSKTHEFANGVWCSGEMPIFEFQAPDSIQQYDLSFLLRVNSEYDYQNIWILMHTEKPDGSFSTDTVNLQLCDERGRWLGKKNGAVYSYQAVFGKNHRFRPVGKYKIRMEHAVMEPNLRGVLDLSLMVEKSDN